MSLQRNYRCNGCGIHDKGHIKSDDWSDWYEVRIQPIDYASGWGESGVILHLCEKCGADLLKKAGDQ